MWQKPHHPEQRVDDWLTLFNIMANDWKLDDGRTIRLFTPQELASLPDDTVITSINGESRQKVVDSESADDDTRFGFTAWGFIVPPEQLLKEALVK